MTSKPSNKAALPTKEQLVEFIGKAPSPPTRRELLRAFGIGAKHRAAFKHLLGELEATGQYSRTNRRRRRVERLPRVTVIEVIGTDEDGETLARPVKWGGKGPSPLIMLRSDHRGGSAPGIGDRLLARLSGPQNGRYHAQIMRRIEAAPTSILGVYLGSGRARSTDRKWRHEWHVSGCNNSDIDTGEILVLKPLPARRLGPRRAEIIDRLGVRDGPKSFSLMAIHSREIPYQFTSAAEKQATAAAPAELGFRTDLRELPLITIDDADARDFDDAVWAEPAEDIPGGWHIVVAIADVAWYVRPGDAIDLCARKRGNSVYFPDRVVPMLPEALSNGLCSLKPAEDRPCIAAHLWIDDGGKLVHQRFERGLMRSRARLTYEQVQSVQDGTRSAESQSVRECTINPLFGAYKTRLIERQHREPLDLEIPEQRFELNKEGETIGVSLRDRLASHRLIEEFMILANVAAAETLMSELVPCLYRVHAPPAGKGLETLRDELRRHGLRLAKGQILAAAHFNRLLRQLDDEADREALQIAILRAQSIAMYDPANIGHFGLSLRNYAHFTSPIRRYADLLVHRALISTTVGGGGGLSKDPMDWDELSKHVSMTERRATAAEREASGRFAAAFLSEKLDQVFEATVNGANHAGLFVCLNNLGIDGFIPARLMPQGPTRRGTRNRQRSRSGATGHKPGSRITVRLREVDPPSGSIVMEPV